MWCRYLLLSRENFDPNSDIMDKVEHYLKNANAHKSAANDRERAYLKVRCSTISPR